MTWRAAFLRQARADDEVRRLLNREGAARCHQLHYLQMCTEKLAKAHHANASGDEPPPMIHGVLVSFLQSLRQQPGVRLALGYRSRRKFDALVLSVLPIAREVERLAPASAGRGQANAEYPWHDAATSQVVAPVDHPFPVLTENLPAVRRLQFLIDRLLLMDLE